MSLINLLVTLIVIGVLLCGLLLWQVGTYTPMEGKLKQMLNVVVMVCVLVWVLSAFVVVGDVHGMAVPPVR